MKRAWLYAGFAAAFGAALPAAAQEAMTTTTVDVHAGPSSDYPQVGVLGPYARVHVDGCLNDWSWCDVQFGNDRGWVYAGDLSYRYRNGPVTILGYGAQLGLPVLSFSLNDYWGEHYRNRPWFAQRDQWARRNIAEEHRGGDHNVQAPREAERGRGEAMRRDTMQNDAMRNERGGAMRNDAMRNDTMRSERNNTMRNERGAMPNDALRNDATRSEGNDTMRNDTMRNDTVRSEQGTRDQNARRSDERGGARGTPGQGEERNNQ